jgi:hypothetical protein
MNSSNAKKGGGGKSQDTKHFRIKLKLPSPKGKKKVIMNKKHKKSDSKK